MLKASYNHGCDRAKEEWKRYQEHALFYSYEHSGDTSEGIYFINTEDYRGYSSFRMEKVFIKG